MYYHAVNDAMATAFTNVVLLTSVILLSCGLASVRAQAACQMLDDQREDCGEWLMICTHLDTIEDVPFVHAQVTLA